MTTTTRLVQHVQASPSQVYRALIRAEDVATWMVPDDMTSLVHAFEPKEGGTFRISLTYDAPTEVGKTEANTDTYNGRFVKLVPGKQVVQTMAFESADPSMQGEMTVTFTLIGTDSGTEVHAVHENVPRGIKPEDNEMGWRMSLEKLANLVEGKAG